MNYRLHFYDFYSLLMAAAFLLLSCKKEKIKIQEAPKARIIIGQKVGANNIFNYYGKNEKYNTVDTLVADTAFHLIIHPPTGNYYFNGINIIFNAQFDTSFNCQYQWKVGEDPLIRTSKQFELDFGRPYGTVRVRLITKYTSKRGSPISGIDTTFQDFYLGDKPPLFGEYEGYNSDNPNHKFKIKIGWDFEPHIAANRSSFYLSNLPEGYPIKSEILDPRSTCFGIFDATIRGGQALQYQNEWVNCIYALGFMNRQHDSIKIRYNYGIIANYPYNSSDWSGVVSKVFIGKKL